MTFDTHKDDMFVRRGFGVAFVSAGSAAECQLNFVMSVGGSYRAVLAD